MVLIPTHLDAPSPVPTWRAAGIAGMLAGIGLALEFAFFMASGWTPTVFDSAGTALEYLRVGGADLRAAAFVGFLNLARGAAPQARERWRSRCARSALRPASKSARP